MRNLFKFPHSPASHRFTFFHQSLVIFAPQTGGPVADASHRVVAQAAWTRVLPADESADLHFRAANELLALQRMGEIALVQALDVSVAM